MANGYAGRYDAASQSAALLCFSNASIATAKTGAELDRNDFKPHNLQHVELVVTGVAALTGGAANDEIDLTLTITDSDTAGSGHATFKTKEFNIVVDDNSSAEFVAVLPVKLNAADRYVNCSVTCVAGTGAPTVSSVVASATWRVHPNSVPVKAGEMGTGSVAYDKDGYVDPTLTA